MFENLDLPFLHDGENLRYLYRELDEKEEWWTMKIKRTGTNCTRSSYSSLAFIQLSYESANQSKSPFLKLRSLFVKASNFSSPTLQEQSLLVNELASDNSQETRTLDASNANTLLCELLQDNGTQELAYSYYQKAKVFPEFRPEKMVMNHLIRYLVNSKKWGLIVSVCEDFRVYKALPDSSYCCLLIRSCIKARKFRVAETVLKMLEFDGEVSVLAYEVAMRGYNKLHMYRSTISLYGRMKLGGIVLNYECYRRIMEAHMKNGEFKRVVTLFEQLENERKSDSIMQPASSSYPAQIYAILCESLGKLGRAFEALEYFRKLMMEEKKGGKEEQSIYASLICTFADMKEVNVVEELFNEAKEKKMLRDPAVFLRVVLMYVEEGSLEKTLDVVKAMDAANTRVSDCIFCAIVNGYSKKRSLTVSVKIFEDLVKHGCEPGQVTYASVISIYCRLALYSKAESVFLEMEKKGYDKCVVAYSSMVVMYGKTGRVSDAMRLVAKMKERKCNPNVWIYNSLMEMHGKVKNLRQVDKLWKEMKRRKVTPDKVSYTTIVNAYSIAEEFDECVKLYHEFRVNGGILDKAIAGLMVGIFAKIGRVDELVKIMQDMKMEGTGIDDRLYWSSLHALKDAGLQGAMIPALVRQIPSPTTLVRKNSSPGS